MSLSSWILILMDTPDAKSRKIQGLTLKLVGITINSRQNLANK